MPLTLHLGVIDLPYVARPSKRKRKAAAGTKTTGDVAEILEDRYGLVEKFWEVYEGRAIEKLSDGIEGALESFVMGAPPKLDPFGKGLSEVEDLFKQFLSTQEAERVGIPGTPTQAALRGVNHRLKRPYVKRAPRPSFVDTGLYQSSFRAWID